MKFICIGRNYAAHAVELGNALPEEPVLFLKPDTAHLTAGHDFFIPEWTKDVHYECEVVFRVSKEGKYISRTFAHSHIDAIGLGIDFTARDLQTQLKAKGLPWERAKAFNGSAVMSEFRPLRDYPNLRDIHFELRVNGELRQKGWTGNMIFPVEEMIAYASQYFTFRSGDVLFTGTPEGVGPVKAGDVLEGTLNGVKVLNCRIR
jgi:acylpyruvate hydrolase